MFLFLINPLISLGIWSTPKESNYYYYYYYYFAHTKQPNEFQYQNTHQDLLYKPHPLFWLDYLEKKHH